MGAWKANYWILTIVRFEYCWAIIWAINTNYFRHFLLTTRSIFSRIHISDVSSLLETHLSDSRPRTTINSALGTIISTIGIAVASSGGSDKAAASSAPVSVSDDKTITGETPEEEDL